MKIYLSEPVVDGPVWVDDLGPLPETKTASAPGLSDGMRNWQKFVGCYVLAVATIALLLRRVVLETGGNEAGGVFIVVLVGVVATAAMIVTLTLAARLGRL